MYEIQPLPIHALTISILYIQLSQLNEAEKYLTALNPADFEQRKYLFYGTKSEFYFAKNDYKNSLKFIDLAIATVHNSSEKKHLKQKKLALENLV